MGNGKSTGPNYPDYDHETRPDSDSHFDTRAHTDPHLDTPTTATTKVPAEGSKSAKGNGNGNGVPGGKRGWYRVREIVSQARAGSGVVYLVEWEGRDPRTGCRWPGSWVNAKDVSASAIREWERKQQQMRDQSAM
ncbi:hypothetical protein F5B20DRAFT_518420, partial [Whalleya microplaca]